MLITEIWFKPSLLNLQHILKRGIQNNYLTKCPINRQLLTALLYYGVLGCGLFI